MSGGLRRRWLAPALAFVAARILLLAAAAWSGQRLWDAGLWMRWDSFHYAAIAEHGYEIHPCAPGEGVPGAPWCGDAGWFPGYPWLIRAVSAAGVPAAAAGAAIAAAAAFAALALLWNLFLAGRPGGRSALLLAALFPGAVYQHAAFPMSLVVCGVAAIAAFIRDGRPAAAAAAAAATATLHPLSAVLAPAALAAALLDRHPRRRSACVAAACGIGAGLAAVLIVQRFDLGVWDGWSRVQEMSRYAPGDPSRWRRMLYIPIVIRPTGATKLAVLAQSAFVAALVAGAAIFRGPEVEGADAWLGAALAALWLAPHLSGYRQSYYRSESVLAPLAAWAPRWPRAWRWAAVAVAAAVTLLTAREFFQGRLV